MAKVNKKATGKLRIIAGEWRSRILPVLDLPGLRPTTDRVRETLFNWLQNDLVGAHCLDVFAGSGALGFEAASRGCAAVTMLELQREASDVLSENIRLLNAHNIQLLQKNALDWLSVPAQQQFDIVFLDPPFDSDYLHACCERLEHQGWLSEQALIYLETDSHLPLPELPANWMLQKQKKAGQVSYYLARRNALIEN